MKQKRFFTTAVAAVCAFSSFPPLPCSAGDTQEATKTEYVALEAEKDTYTFTSNGYVDTITVYGVTESGAKAALGDAVQYSSKDTDVVSVYHDNIRAEGKGATGITAEYAGLTLEIPMVVENEIDLDALEASLRVSSEQTLYLPESLPAPDSSLTDKILDRAATMKNVRWTPVKDFSVQNHDMVFQAGHPYEGIPYSPFTQVDDAQFLEQLKHADDFYTPVTVGFSKNGETLSSSFPRYGIDASGYVCFALGTRRVSSAQMVEHLKNGTGEVRKVGNYDPNAPTKESMYQAYKVVQPGNAIVHYGHAAVVLSNDTFSESIVVYEITNRFPQVTIYNYSTLWNNGKNCYFPFVQSYTMESIEQNKGVGTSGTEIFSSTKTYSTFTKSKGITPEAPYRAQLLISGTMLDFDGDGKQEKVTYHTEEDLDTGCSHFVITIGKNTYQTGEFTNGQIADISLFYASLDGVTLQFMIKQHDDWASDFLEVYTCENGSLTLAGILPDADYGMLTEDGQPIFSCITRCHPLQNDMVEVYYKFEDGKLQKIQKGYYRFLETWNGGRNIFRLRQDVKFYDRKNSKETFTLPEGSRITTLGGDLSGWIFIKDIEGGKKGWLKVSGKVDGVLGSYWASDCILPDGNSVPCGELFEGLQDYD